VTVPVTTVTPSRAQREPAPVDRIATCEHRQPAPSMRPTDPRREARFASLIGSGSRRPESGTSYFPQTATGPAVAAAALRLLLSACHANGCNRFRAARPLGRPSIGGWPSGLRHRYSCQHGSSGSHREMSQFSARRVARQATDSFRERPGLPPRPFLCGTARFQRWPRANRTKHDGRRRFHGLAGHDGD
jgi:hypothetical protein